MKKIMISVAPVAATDILINPRAIARDVYECYKNGAAMVHLHCRDRAARLQDILLKCDANEAGPGLPALNGLPDLHPQHHFGSRRGLIQEFVGEPEGAAEGDRALPRGQNDGDILQHGGDRVRFADPRRGQIRRLHQKIHCFLPRSTR